MKASLSQTESEAGILSTKTIVLPPWLISLMILAISVTNIGDKPSEGSSKRSNPTSRGRGC